MPPVLGTGLQAWYDRIPERQTHRYVRRTDTTPSEVMRDAVGEYLGRRSYGLTVGDAAMLVGYGRVSTLTSTKIAMDDTLRQVTVK